MNDDFKVYVLAEMAYKKEHSDISEEELFPVVWTVSKDYRLKTDIIVKAIKNKKLITEIEEYENI